MPARGRPLFWRRTYPLKITDAPLLSRSTSESSVSTSITSSTIAVRISASCHRRNDRNLVARREHDIGARIFLIHSDQRRRRQNATTRHRPHMLDDVSHRCAARQRDLDALSVQDIRIRSKEERGHGHTRNVQADYRRTRSKGGQSRTKAKGGQDGQGRSNPDKAKKLGLFGISRG